MENKPINNDKMELPDNYEINSDGTVIDKTTNEVLSVLKHRYNNAVFIEGKFYDIKDLVYSKFGEPCNYNHFVKYVNSKPTDFNKDDIRNLTAVTWREYYGWSSRDIDPTDAIIHYTISDEVVYEMLRQLKPLIQDKESLNFSLSTAIPPLVSVFKKCNNEALTVFFETLKMNVSLIDSVPIILNAFIGDNNDFSMTNLITVVNLIKNDKDSILIRLTPTIVKVFKEHNHQILPVIFNLMEKDDDPTRLFKYDEAYKKSKPDNDFKGLNWILEQNKHN